MSTITHLNPADLHTNPAFSQGTLAEAGRTLYVGGQNGTDSNGDIVGKICAETGKSVREVVLERGLLTESELDDIFSVQNLMYPVYKAKRYTDENEQ